MDYKIEETKEKRYVIGIAIRTSNQKFRKEALPLWDRFFRHNLEEKIPGKKNNNLFVVYSGYEKDHTKPFDYLIGCEVDNLNNIPETMTGIEIPTSSYAVYTAQGLFPQSMINTWNAIWNAKITRTFAADFEVYPPDFHKKNDPEVKIYIGIKS